MFFISAAMVIGPTPPGTGVIQAARKSRSIARVYAGLDGINGVLDENLIDLAQESADCIEALRYTPAGAFGSCRKKLQDLEKHGEEFQRILDVLEAHDVGTFFYNGGNDSMDTVAKLATFASSSARTLLRAARSRRRLSSSRSCSSIFSLSAPTIALASRSWPVS